MVVPRIANKNGGMKLMIFKTISGSLYELDTAQRKVRRLTGEANPQPRQGSDGEWKEYADVTDVKVGISVLIVWEFDSSNGDDQMVVARSTLTSAVAEIVSLAEPLEMVS